MLELFDHVCSVFGLPLVMNRTILSGLKYRLESLSDQLEWDEHLSEVLMAYRATPHSVTRESPNAIMLGREIRFPPLWEFGDLVSPDYITSGYISELQDRLANVHAD